VVTIRDRRPAPPLRHISATDHDADAAAA